MPLSRRSLCVFLSVGVWFWLGIAVVSCTAAASLPELGTGDRGTAVTKLQNDLYILGYLPGKPSGTFDQTTANAVRRFQKEHKLQVDGIAGARTQQRLQQVMADIPVYMIETGDTLWRLAKEYNISIDRLMAANSLKSPDKLSVGQKLRIPVPTVVPVETAAKQPVVKAAAAKPQSSSAANQKRTAKLMSWPDVDKLFAVGKTARVTDCKTGLSFQVRRLYGHAHADVEPVTAADTAVFKKIYGGKWCWDRHPVVVEIAGQFIAGSINGMPHGGESITTNQFAGHFCIHFLNSSTHGTGKTDKLHQEAVLAAAGYNVDTLLAKR